MNSIRLAINKLEAAHDLIIDAADELGQLHNSDSLGMQASLAWVSGDVATIIRELEKEEEE